MRVHTGQSGHGRHEGDEMDHPVTDLGRVVGTLGVGAEEALETHLDGGRETASLGCGIEVWVC
jgi:hypothetical protein